MEKWGSVISVVKDVVTIAGFIGIFIKLGYDKGVNEKEQKEKEINQERILKKWK